MDRKDMIALWMQWCEGLLQDIESRDAALNWNILGGEATQLRRIDPIIHVQIAAYLVGLRACLDYIATEIAEKFRINPKRGNVYFPIECQSPNGFTKHMDDHLTGLEAIDHRLYQALESLQPFQSQGCKYLAHLKRLVNENKHLRLTRTRRLRSGYELTSESTIRPFLLSPGPRGGEITSVERLAFADADVLVVPILQGCRYDVETVLNTLAPFGLP